MKNLKNFPLLLLSVLFSYALGFLLPKTTSLNTKKTENPTARCQCKDAYEKYYSVGAVICKDGNLYECSQYEEEPWVVVGVDVCN